VAELREQIQQKAELAVAQMQSGTAKALDYSEASLGALEELLAEAGRYASELPEETAHALIQIAGSYILEVAFRAHGGTFYWHDGRDQPVLVVGEPSYRVAIMTFDKVKGRISGDEADNIEFFYEGFVGKLGTAVAGDDVLYV
jgi:hypothetical protein